MHATYSGCFCCPSMIMSPSINSKSMSFSRRTSIKNSTCSWGVPHAIDLIVMLTCIFEMHDPFSQNCMLLQGWWTLILNHNRHPKNYHSFCTPKPWTKFTFDYRDPTWARLHRPRYVPPRRRVAISSSRVTDLASGQSGWLTWRDLKWSPAAFITVFGNRRLFHDFETI